MPFIVRNTALLIGLLLTGCSTLPERPESLSRGDYNPVKTYVSRLAEAEMKKHDITGLSIALVDDQRVVWSEGFGYADAALEVKAKPETIYRAGSISKLLTATAAMQMYEQGVLDIDKPLSVYLPDFSMKSRFPGSAPVTPRTLMTHHSGLPSDLANGMWTRKPKPYGTILKQLKDEYLVLPPDQVYAYSNLGMTLLGLALEKIGDRDFDVHMEVSLLQPLGMSSSWFSPKLDNIPQISKTYKNGLEVDDVPLRDVPAGGLNTTVLDLSRFMQMVFANGMSGERQIIKPATLAEMLRPQNASVPLDLDFRTGLGWALSGLGEMDIRNAGVVAHHSGATLNHRSMLIVLPERKLGVVVLANSATAGSSVNRLAAETLKLALEVKTGIKQPVPELLQQGAPLTKNELQTYEGRYATFAGVVPVTVQSDHLKAEVMGNSLHLTPRADGLLSLQYKLLGLVPISLGELDHVGIGLANIDEREILKARVNGKDFLVGQKVRSVPIPDRWLARTGEYEIVNAGDDAVLVDNIRLHLARGVLMLDYGMPLFFEGTMSMAMEPVSPEEAIIQGLGRGMGETIRAITDDTGEKLTYSGYILRQKTK